jgi:DNA adenine methylase
LTGSAQTTHVRPGAPLLKWAGGKRQLLPALRRFYPAAFARYFEPFVGSGAVFFDLNSTGRIADRRAILTDANPDLIGCYRAVRDEPEPILERLDSLARGRAADPIAHFYATREAFNAARTRLPAEAPDRYSPDLAAMLIYLNRTGYNGLFRLNALGGYNVPAGRYANPRISDPALLRAVSAILARRQVSLAWRPFDSVLGIARAGDFLYFDPPYAPVSGTSSFTSYTAQRFTLADQARLLDVVIGLADRGCQVVVSNSSAPAIATLYEDDRRVAAAGLRVHRVPARRAINSRASARGPVVEFILTNVTEAPPPHD